MRTPTTRSPYPFSPVPGGTRVRRVLVPGPNRTLRDAYYVSVRPYTRNVRLVARRGTPLAYVEALGVGPLGPLYAVSRFNGKGYYVNTGYTYTALGVRVALAALVAYPRYAEFRRGLRRALAATGYRVPLTA